jgi:hypothetical protein
MSGDDSGNKRGHHKHWLRANDPPLEERRLAWQKGLEARQKDMEKLRLARDGSRAIATILALGELGQDGTRIATMRVQPESGEMFETTKQLHTPVQVGESYPARFDPADHSKLVLLITWPTGGLSNVPAAGGLGHVPTHCPDCGAPVDLAVASVAAHPVCAYCGHSLPRDPA